MERLEQIISLEHKLSEIRIEINRLTLSYNNDSLKDEIIEDKLKFLECEARHLNNQIIMLRKKESNVTTTKTIQQTKPIYQRPVQIQKPKEKKEKDFERTIGKSVMGIAASILIFISIILFATLLYPYLNDTIKLIGMYGISAVFTGFGLYKLKSDKNNKFFLSLSGCGIGAIYISLLLTNIYFKLINEITLYILLLIWTIVTCYLSKQKSKLFQIIGEIGILISIIFGSVYCVDIESIGYMIVLILYFFITSGVYLYAHFDKDIKGNLLHYIFNTISLIILGSVACGLCQEKIEYMLIGTSLTMYVLIKLLINYFLINNKQNIIFGIFNAIYMFIMSLITVNCFDEPFAYALHIIIGISFIALTTFINQTNENLYNNDAQNKLSMIICNISYLLMIFIAIFEYENFIYASLLMAYIIGTAILYFKFENKTSNVFTFIALFTFILSNEISDWSHLILGLLVILALFAALYKIHYNQVNKIINYLMMLLLIYVGIGRLCYDIKHEYETFIMFIILASINILALKTFFITNWDTEEKEKASLATCNIINLLIMISSLSYINDYEFLKVLVIIVAFGLYFINTRNILEKFPNILSGIYVGGKYTVLIIIILSSYEAPSYLISIACFIFAIASILLGFNFKYKQLRTYGLILSLFSVVKLILLDIQYENTIGHAFSFFICGLLCFAISIIYTRIDKKINEE